MQGLLLHRTMSRKMRATAGVFRRPFGNVR